MPWFRCEARGEPRMATVSAFAATRFVEADAEATAALCVRRSVARELVRRGACPLSAETLGCVDAIQRIDEDEVPGIVAPDLVWLAAA